MVDFFDFEDFFDVEVDALASPEAGAAAVVSAVSAFLDFEDFFELELLVSVLDAAAVVSEEAVDFLDLEDFDVELSATVEEPEASAFLLLDVLPVAELSVAEAASLVVLFFFFLDFVVLVLVSLWSFDCVDWEDCDA